MKGCLRRALDRRSFRPAVGGDSGHLEGEKASWLVKNSTGQPAKPCRDSVNLVPTRRENSAGEATLSVPLVEERIELLASVGTCAIVTGEVAGSPAPSASLEESLRPHLTRGAKFPTVRRNHEDRPQAQLARVGGRIKRRLTSSWRSLPNSTIRGAPDSDLFL